ncbi:hypothetical protein ACHQM5_008710 [Ranunculus cassubicifolius]
MSKLPSLERKRYQIPHSAKKEKTNFFKIIHGNIIEHQQLDLPKGFVAKHGKELCDMVKVEVPNGSSWNIKVRKADGVHFFCGSGWKDFVDHHSIDVGHVLFFTYYGISRFSVIICGVNATEISYPPKVTNTENPRSKYHTAEIGETSCVRGEEVMTPYCSPKAFARKCSLVEHSSSTRAGRGHKSKNPSFVLVMQPSYVEGKYCLNVPMDFVTKYLGTQDRVVNLQLSEAAPYYGQVWVARYFYYGDMAKFYRWKDFAIHNRLKVNDTCVFELIDMEITTFAITIYRNGLKYAVPKVEVPEKQLILKRKTRLEAEYPFESQHRFFIIKLARSYVHQGFLHLPMVFREYLPKETRPAEIVDSNGRNWYVKYLADGCNSRISEGWDVVVRDCGLKEDFVFAMELIDDQDILLKISILGHHRSEDADLMY